MVGCGDVARRILPLLRSRYRVFALLRRVDREMDWRELGAVPVQADLDQPATLGRLAGLADAVIHLAPPPGQGLRDTRTRALVAALSKGGSLPRSLIYVSTTGVYGDCGGAWIDETRSLHPDTARARRRVDAEQVLRAWGAREGVAVSVLRAPGIYAADRLPVERLKSGLPALSTVEDVFTNHIHADDLAAACVAALRRGRPSRCYNVVDGSDLKMGDYLDRVADALNLPHPPRLPRTALRQAVSPVHWSFMCESRRIGNRRLCEELRLRLRYPTVDVMLAALSGGAVSEKIGC